MTGQLSWRFVAFRPILFLSRPRFRFLASIRSSTGRENRNSLRPNSEIIYGKGEEMGFQILGRILIAKSPFLEPIHLMRLILAPIIGVNLSRASSSSFFFFFFSSPSMADTVYTRAMTNGRHRKSLTNWIKRQLVKSWRGANNQQAIHRRESGALCPLPPSPPDETRVCIYVKINIFDINNNIII